MKYLQDITMLPVNQQDQNHKSTLKEKHSLIEQAKGKETGL